MGAVIGIDLGTTNTVVAAIRDGRPVALGDESGATSIPSIVSFLPSGAVMVGNAAKERRSQDPRNTIYSVKRFIGRTWDSDEVRSAVARLPFELREGPGRATFVVARGETYTLPEISAFVLRKARSIAELALGEPVDRAVITVPANFNDLQRAATKVAGRVAGLEVLRILNEPTAAALAFGYSRGNRERIAVFDFGGGTFDCTLLQLSEDVFEVLATAGNTFLGGDDIDVAILERMANAVGLDSIEQGAVEPDSLERLRAAAEHLKQSLSETREAVVPLAASTLLPRSPLEFGMTRDELESLIDPIVARTLTVCQDALTMARLTPREIDHVLLVGGSTRIPLVRQRVEEFFSRRARTDLDPHEAVALGAAQQAMALTQVRATASGIPLAPAQRQEPPQQDRQPLPVPAAQQNHVSGVGAGSELPRKTTDPGVGLGESIEPGRVSVVPPSGPLTSPAPTTRNFGSDDRVTTGVGLGPSAEATPFTGVQPSAVVHEQIVHSAAPNTLDGLGPQQPALDALRTSKEAPTAELPVVRPAAAQTPTPSHNRQVFGREPTIRVTRDSANFPDLSTTLPSAATRSNDRADGDTQPRTDPLFVPTGTSGVSHQLGQSQHRDPPLVPARPIAPPAKSSLEPRTVRGIAAPVADGTRKPSEGRSGHAGNAGLAPEKSKISDNKQRFDAVDPNSPLTLKTAAAATTLGAKRPEAPHRSTRPSLIDEAASWDEAPPEEGAELGLPIVVSQPRTAVANMATTQVSATLSDDHLSSKDEPITDLPLVVARPPQQWPNTSPGQAVQLPIPKVSAESRGAPGAATGDPPQVPPPIASPASLPEVKLGLPEPELDDAVSDDDEHDLSADEPTAVRRPGRRTQDSPPTDVAAQVESGDSDHGNVANVSQGETIALPAVASPLTPPSAMGGRQHPLGRPTSLDEQEIRARYGDLPLIVGGKRVGARATDTAVDATPAQDQRHHLPALAETSIAAAISAGLPALASARTPAQAGAATSSTEGLPPIATGRIPGGQGAPRAPLPRSPQMPAGSTPRTLEQSPTQEPIHSLELEPIPLKLDEEVRQFDGASLPLTGESDPPSSEPSPKSYRPPTHRDLAKQSASDEQSLPIPDLPPPPSTHGSGGALHQQPVAPPKRASTAEPPPRTSIAASPAVEKPAPATAPVQRASNTIYGLGLPLGQAGSRDAVQPLGATVQTTNAWQPPTKPLASDVPKSSIGTAQEIRLPSLLSALPMGSSTHATSLVDVTPLSLCVETVGGYVDVLVARNTPIPCERTRSFVTAHDNQQTVVVRIAQGESRLFQENTQLGEVVLTGIPAAPRGQARIAVTFGLDSDGILHVRALEVGSGQSALADLRLAGAVGPPEVANLIARQAAKGHA